MTNTVSQVAVDIGLSTIGPVPWGAHFCHIYDGRDELADGLTSYFKAGLESNDYCLWITAEPLQRDDAISVLRSAVGDLDARMKRGQIDVIDHREWYQRQSEFSAGDVIDRWLGREADALTRGYRGLRLTGNTSWLTRTGWNDFMAYETKASERFADRRIVAMCSYCRFQWNEADVGDVVCRHQFTVARQERRWAWIECGSAASGGASMSTSGTQGNLEAPTPARTLGDVLYAKPRAVESEQDWAALVQATAGGDQAALQALYERAHRPVFTLAMRLTANRETAEELTIDVFHDVWRRAAQYDAADGTVLGWIMNQARSRSIDRLRFESRKKRNLGDAAPLLVEDAAPDPRDVLELRQESETLRAALATLTPGERLAIETTFFTGLTHAEAAARLDQPLGTIKTRIRSALHKLRRALDDKAAS